LVRGAHANGGHRAIAGDANGIAKFMVPPYYKARFSVGYRDKHNKYISESITYETNGPQDANNIFTLQISDELLYQIFK